VRIQPVSRGTDYSSASREVNGLSSHAARKSPCSDWASRPFSEAGRIGCSECLNW